MDLDLAALFSEPESVNEAIEKFNCERSLLEFFKRAWREIPEVSRRRLSINWHHEVIIYYLEAITRGWDLEGWNGRDLIINVPPRHSKSLLVSLIWPAWIWAQPRELWGPLSGPHVSFLAVSYDATLAGDWGQKHKDLISTEWYQRHWGDQVSVDAAFTAREHFKISAGGERFSRSIGGGSIGRGGDIRIYDDPQSRRQADSVLERRESLRGMSDMVTRFTDPSTSAQVLIMQRLHVADATDWALKNWPDDTKMLMFPARFDSSRACDDDPREEDGELLWPDVWTEEQLTKIEHGLAGFEEGEAGLSRYAISGQLQQAPIPMEGGIIGYSDWMTYPEAAPNMSDLKRRVDGTFEVMLPAVSYVLVCLDTAYSEKETADWNACVVLGVWQRPRSLVSRTNPFAGRWAGYQSIEELTDRVIEEGEQPRVMLMEAWRKRCKMNDSRLDRYGRPEGLVQRVIDTARRRHADRILIEDKTRGQDVKNEIERQIRFEGYGIELFNPTRHGDKVARLNSVQPQFSQGLVYKPANLVARRDNYGREYVAIENYVWVEQVQTEVNEVPSGPHDDLADALSMGLIWLRDGGFLKLTKEYIEQRVQEQVWHSHRAEVRDGYGV